jgi:hypothetical protein
VIFDSHFWWDIRIPMCSGPKRPCVLHLDHIIVSYKVPIISADQTLCICCIFTTYIPGCWFRFAQFQPHFSVVKPLWHWVCPNLWFSTIEMGWWSTITLMISLEYFRWVARPPMSHFPWIINPHWHHIPKTMTSLYLSPWSRSVRSTSCCVRASGPIGRAWMWPMLPWGDDG